MQQTEEALGLALGRKVVSHTLICVRKERKPQALGGRQGGLC